MLRVIILAALLVAGSVDAASAAKPDTRRIKKYALIGLGGGLAVGTTYAIANTYNFDKGRMVRDDMTKLWCWGVMLPILTVSGGVTGGLAGFIIGEKKSRK